MYVFQLPMLVKTRFCRERGGLAETGGMVSVSQQWRRLSKSGCRHPRWQRPAITGALVGSSVPASGFQLQQYRLQELSMPWLRGGMQGNDKENAVAIRYRCNSRTASGLQFVVVGLAQPPPRTSLTLEANRHLRSPAAAANNVSLRG